MYIAFAVFAAGTAWKVYRIARMPIHLRWDLYPIPHEKGRAHYGGSYYEEFEWWTKPRETSRLNELWAMAKEIFFIQSLYHHNRSLWIWSFPFHLGLYLLVGFLLALATVALAGTLAPEQVIYSSAGSIFVFLAAASPYIGTVGALFLTVGSLGLLVSRLINRDLRSASGRTDYFNLMLLGAVGASLMVTDIRSRAGFLDIYFFIRHLVTLSPAQPLAPAATAHVLLAGIFLLWLPMTHMTHFVGKYFTYHRVRWEDHPNLRGSKIESALNRSLGYPITWSAPHISGKTWADAASAPGREEEKP